MTQTSTRPYWRVVGLTASLLVAVLAAATAEPIWISGVLAGVLLMTAAVAIATDGLVAACVGLLGSVSCLVVMHALGSSELTSSPAAFAIVGGATAAGMFGGSVGSIVRGAARHPANWHESVPMAGSLGLLHPSLGELRLGEEVTRARHAGRPLSIMRVRMQLWGETLDPADRDRVLRVLGRAFETTLEFIHIPFAYSEFDLVAILPEAEAVDAWEVGGRLASALGRGYVLIGPRRIRRPFYDFAATTTTFATYGRDGESADALLAATLAQPGTSAPRNAERRVLVVALPQPPVIPSRPAVVASQPAVVPSQSAVVPSQPNVIPWRPTVMPSQPTLVPSLSNDFIDELVIEELVMQELQTTVRELVAVNQ
jgi:hypothetical protein